MHIIIDGYNIIKQIIHQKEISTAQRRAFINLLSKYQRTKNHTITIVFDGGDSIWPEQEKDHEITVIYSGTKKTADDIIKEYIYRKKVLLVVSSDADIKDEAYRHNVTTIDAMEFYSILKQTLQPKQDKKKDNTFIKTTKEENKLLDMLMQQDKQPIYKYDENPENNRQSKGHTLSKKERSYLQKIKKLQ